ncbi:hypothetical protein [Ruegeria sp.]|uniref:hypothetical protein n=1 Tax=Ruegeria sp. TaxID=1879320 RepID=UPI0023257ED1|nr:hypothetical protein [Ruegeria sp.]MDA7966653.1 hypothetical protein [Ruegeria sp.]
MDHDESKDVDLSSLDDVPVDIQNALLSRACIRMVPMLGSELRTGKSFLLEPPNDTVLGAFRALATATVITVNDDNDLKRQLMYALNSECFVDDASHGFQDHGNCIDAIRQLSEKLLPGTFLAEADYVLEAIINSIYGSHALDRVQSDLNILCPDQPVLTRPSASQRSSYELPLWNDGWLIPETLELDVATFEANSRAVDGKWQYWIDWYQSFAMGRPLDWELQRRVVMIEEKFWNFGAGAIAAEIERIRKELEQQQRTAHTPIEPTEHEVSLIEKSVVQNRDAIVVSTAGLIEQVEAFREKIRGMNSLEAELRSEILEFTDYFHQHLQQLLASLPQPNDDLSEERAGRIALWLRDYKGVLWTKLAHYSSPENIAEASVPTGIVLTATGIGAMFGQPLAGAAVGGLITNQMKSSQAAKEFLKPTDTEGTEGK